MRMLRHSWDFLQGSVSVLTISLLLLLLLLVCRAEAVAGIPAKKAVVTNAVGGKATVVAPNVHISKVRCTQLVTLGKY
jgi:hypothetical protein